MSVLNTLTDSAMKYKVIRPNTTLKIGKKAYKTDDVFEAKEESVKSLLENKYIEEINDGKSTDS